MPISKSAFLQQQQQQEKKEESLATSRAERKGKRDQDDQNC